MIAWISANYVELLGVIFSVLYLVFSIRQNILLWPVGILSALMYVVVFFHAKFYADMSLNVYYFAISIYGWFNWTRGGSGDSPLQVVRTDKKLAVRLMLVFVLLFFGTGVILNRFTDSPLPYWDALTTSASIVATWMLTKKILEHWIIWVFVDLVSLFLYVYRELYPTALLFALYTIMAIAGYRKWKASMTS